MPTGARRVLTVLLVCLLLAGAGLARPAVARAQEGDPPILAGSEIGYPPFCVVDGEGQADGFSVELMRAALAAMGRDVTFMTGPWTDVRGWLESGKVQALPLVGRTPEREAFFDFTVPYMSLYGAIVVRDDTTDIASMADLRGRDVAVMQGDNAEEYLRREERGIRIHTTATFEQALQELSEGTHDAVVIQHLVALRLLGETGLTNLRVAGRPIEDFRQDFCFAVREGDKDMLALLNEGLSLVIADGTYRSLHTTWFAALELPTDRPIIVGGDSDYPPIEYLDENGRPAGYGVELTYAIAQALGLTIEIRLQPWDQTRSALEAGTVDIVQGMFYSPERDEIFDFTQPHLVAHGVAVCRTGEGEPPGTIEELQDMRIVVQEGDIMHDWALQNGLEAQVTAVSSPEEALRAVSEGRYDCTLLSRVVALSIINSQGWKNLVVGTRSLSSSEYCYAVAAGRTGLLAQFGEGLKLLDESGEYRRIYQKWMGVYEEARPDTGIILRYVAYVGGPLLLVLILAVLWLWSLRREVARRTEELRKSEEQLRQSQKMEAVGQLAGGIAHDFNNLLTAITGYCELLLADGTDCNTGAREDIKEIKRAAERAGSLTKQILAFSRRQPMRPDVVSVNNVLDGMTPLLRRTLGEDIDLVSLQDPDVGLTEVDVHQFEQVLLNLAVNARDAMPAGGRLTLETADVELDEEYARTHSEVDPGLYVMLAVSDTGSGMDEATLQHAFEPFFTTKEPGQGTGLGLAVVYGIVKQSRGHVTVYSEPGRGTTFKIYLPRVHGRHTVELPVTLGPALAPGSGTVVVVEDETAVRRLVDRVLRREGYEVVSYGTADEALAAIEEGQSLDLLLTDVVLPGVLQSKDLVERLQQIEPGLSILYMSGYTRNAIVHAGRLDAGVNFLEKPFTPEVLARTVRQVMEQAKA